MPHEPLMILGASTRAAAQSAVRAGFRPLCADRFADEDLYEVAEVLPLADYPQGLIAAAAAAPLCPWMYTGALENHPGLLRTLASQRTLHGNPADVVVRVRDPFAVARVLREAGLRSLQLCPGDQPLAPDGRWLQKPRRSAGGRGIRVWDGQPAVAPAGRRAEPCYFQERVFGEPHSALYLATSDQTLLVGVARQLIGESQLGAAPFAYCGSIGPVRLGESLQRQIVQWGQVLGSEFRLRGLFGIDFMIDDDSLAWLTEVNPRYTASVEILESALGVPLLRDHVLASAAFGEASRSRQIAEELQARLDAATGSLGGSVCGKAVVYAPFSLRTPRLADLMRQPALANNGVRIADRPQPGSLVPARAPLCTLLIDDLPPAPASAATLTPFEPALAALAAHLESNREVQAGIGP
jgi:uncharacterized protein